MVLKNEALIRISSVGTISIPKNFRKHLNLQKGDYVKVVLGQDSLVIRRVVIS